jgi:hypothetical protein
VRAAHVRVLVLAVGCAGDDAGTGPTDTETLCEGAGEGAIAVGSGGLSGFVPWEDGDPVILETDGAGRWGFYADLLTEGIDTTASTTALVRFSVGDDPTTEDLGATLDLQCPNEGPGWFGLFVPLDDARQDPAVVDTLVGQTMSLSATVTDQASESATVSLELVVGL